MSRGANGKRRRCPRKNRDQPRRANKPKPRDHALRPLMTLERYRTAASDWAKETGKPLFLPFFGKLNTFPFSNHAYTPTPYKGKVYKTSEHAYLAEQARCYGLHREAEAWTAGEGRFQGKRRVYYLADPKHVKSHSTEAFRAFKDPNHPARKTWLGKRCQVMYRIVLNKFRRNPLARDALLKTGHQFLVETSPTDAYWGLGQPNGQHILDAALWEKLLGTNRLGLILMAVRDSFRKRRTLYTEMKVREKRRLVARAQKKALPQHHALIAHFARQLAPGVAAVSRPKKRVPDHPPLPPQNLGWRFRNARAVLAERRLASKY